MTHLQFTLFAEGTTDRALLPILDWLLRETHRPATVGREFLPKTAFKPAAMTEHLRTAVELSPCDILFVHRDADKQDPECRYKEVEKAIGELAKTGLTVPHVCVVPVRMTEAWLLSDESALRLAAGNPNGKQPLQIPKVKHLESIPDPKAQLHGALRTASGKNGRRLASFDAREAAALVPEFIASFATLRQLSAFSRLEADLRKMSL